MTRKQTIFWAKTSLTAFFLLSGTFFTAAERPALADYMTSDSFVIQSDVLSAGGGLGTSSGFLVDDAIGEGVESGDSSSAGFTVCSGYECLMGEGYITFSVLTGLNEPDEEGDLEIDLGDLGLSQVNSSGLAGVKSVFLRAESTVPGGAALYVSSENGALESVSVPESRIESATDLLEPGRTGYGLCVFAASAESGTFSPSSPYGGVCDKSVSHGVGVVDGAYRRIVYSESPFGQGEAEILVKASIGTEVDSYPDYADTLTFIMTATY